MKTKLKSNRTMEFIKRVVSKDKTLLEDHFRHKETGVVLVRTQYTYGERNDKFVMWYCPELGSGNSGLSYWIQMARFIHRKSHDDANRLIQSRSAKWKKKHS